MSHSYTHRLSTRLFIQAALTGLLAPTARGSTWLVLTLAVAAGALAVGLLLRSSPPNGRQMVIGFEAVALAVGALGLLGGHYIPGTIVGVVTLIATAKSGGGPPAADPWVVPADATAYPPPAAPVEPAPVLPTPAAFAPVEPASVQTMAPVDAAAPPVDAPSPLVPPQPAALTPIAEPLRPEDIPPAPRSMTIVPGK
jgi:hypothetical protein